MLDSATIAQVVTFMGVVVGFYAQWKREGRQRQWDTEDREVKAKELAEKVTNEARALSKQTEAHVAQIKEGIAENTKLTKQNLEGVAENTKLTRRNAEIGQETTAIATKAFHEANTVNQKLEKIGLENVAELKTLVDEMKKNADLIGKEEKQ